MARALSIELGGSHAVVAVVEDRAVLRAAEVPVSVGSDLRTLLPKLAELSTLLLRETATSASDLVGATLSLAALVDSKTHRIVATNGKYPDSQQIDLSRWARESFGLRLLVENDARMALLGERYAGAAQGADTVVMLTLGTGIGGAVLVDGKPLRTAHPQGGCLGGHIPVRINGRLCSCGALGCMEAEASTWALPAILEEWPGIENSAMAGRLHSGFKGLFAEAEAGDPIAVAVKDHCLQVWSVGTVGLIHAYGPELVLLGGGVMRNGDIVLQRIRDYAGKYAWQPTAPARIERARLGPDAALYGSLPLLLEGRF